MTSEDFRPKPKSKLEQMNESLYSPNTKDTFRSRKKLRPKEDQGQELKTDWNGEDEKVKGQVPEQFQPEQKQKQKKKKGLNWLNWLAIISGIFFLIATAYGAFVFIQGFGSVSGKNVAVEIVAPVSIPSGEELSFDVVVQNDNKVDIENARIIVELPNGTKDPEDFRRDLTRLEVDVGQISAGTVVKRNFSAVLFGEEGDDREIRAIVDYKIANSNADFRRETDFKLSLQSSPIRLNIESVKEITPGQDLTFNVEISSNSNTDLDNVLLVVDYPFGFNFIDASQEPASGNNIWTIDELKPNETKEIRLTGQLEGQSNEERVFRFSIGLAKKQIFDEIDVLFTEIPQSITISQPFLALDLRIDSDSRPVVVKRGNTTISGQLRFKNNTEDIIQNAEAEIQFVGSVLDSGSVDVFDGFYDSLQEKIVWNSRNTEVLESISPGQIISLPFTFSSLPLADGNEVFKNPEITLDAKIKGRRVSETGVPEVIEPAAFRRVQFESDVTISGQSGRNTGSFTDTGPIPPKVGEETTYTLTLSLANSSNKIDNARITAILPDYVKWQNKISPSSETVNFDPITRLVEWNIGEIAEHTGYLSPTKKVSFQISITPSFSQVDSAPTLLRNPTFSGTDIFVDRDIEIIGEIITTYTFGSINLENGEVVQ